MKRIYVILMMVTAILAIPLIAMRFTTEVNWDAKDFVLMGGLLLIAGLGIELVLRNVKYKINRFFYAVLL